MACGVATGFAVAVLACRQLVGIGDDPPPGSPTSPADAGTEAEAGTDAGGFTYGQGDCATCVTTSCGTQEMACAGNASCSQLEGCMSGCGTDPTCRAQCGVDHGLGNDGATPAFEACLATSCPGACGLTCGGLAAVFPPATAPACEACILKQECAPTSACAADVGCQTSLRCLFSSTTFDVQEACPGLAPDSGPPTPLSNNASPIASSCSTECSWGADWSCVGRFNWPPGTLGPIDVTAVVYDVLSQFPTVGATVKLCNSQDFACTPPLDMRVTDDAGIALLHRGPAMASALAYLDVSSSAIAPVIEFDVAPESVPRFRVPVPTLTPALFAQTPAVVEFTPDPSLGMLYVAAVDCRLAAAPGVQFSIAPMAPTTRVFYQANNAYSTTATATDATGLAEIFDVPVMPTTLELTATPQALGRTSGKMAVFTRLDTEAIVVAEPTP
jgi:hypothetical protein